MVFVAKVNDFIRFESSHVVGNDFLRAVESRQDVVLKKLDDGGVIGLPTRDGFNSFGEIVGGC